MGTPDKISTEYPEIVEEQLVSDEMLLMLIAEVEAIINGRPLTLIRMPDSQPPTTFEVKPVHAAWSV